MYKAVQVNSNGSYRQVAGSFGSGMRPVGKPFRRLTEDEILKKCKQLEEEGEFGKAWRTLVCYFENLQR